MGVLEIINVLFMIFFFVIAYMSVRYFINQIEKYPRVTHEEVYDSKKLRKKYPNDKIVILDSPSDREQIYETLKNVNDENVYFFEDSRTILDSISLINRSDLVVSLDTSILHLGEGLNRKVMAFYGPKLNKNKWRIKEEGNILIDFPEKNINDIDFEKLLCNF